MKRLSAIILSAIMALSVCACGGGAKTAETTTATEEITVAEAELSQMSKEDLISSAETVESYLMNNDYFENKAKAKLNYCDKPIITKAYVYMVNDDHVVLGCGESAGAQVCIAAYMPLEDLVKIKASSVIKIVGIVSDIEERDFVWGGMTVKYPHYVMDTAFLIEE